ncbi:hypothetical protein D9M68_1006880 [compost metagenome]
MTKCLQLARPVVGSAASFHANQARRQIGEEGNHLVALELLLQYGLAVSVDAVNLEEVLR